MSHHIFQKKKPGDIYINDILLHIFKHHNRRNKRHGHPFSTRFELHGCMFQLLPVGGAREERQPLYEDVLLQ